MKSPSARDGGSVLIDALVAIAIVAISAAFAAEAVGDGALRTRAGEQTRLAELEARSRMAEVGGDIGLAVGRAGGTDGDLAWSIDITPATGPAGRQASTLLSVVVTISGPDGRTLITLRSLRVAGP